MEKLYVMDARKRLNGEFGIQGPFRNQAEASDYADSLNRFVAQNTLPAFLLAMAVKSVGPFFPIHRENLKLDEKIEIDRLNAS